MNPIIREQIASFSIENYRPIVHRDLDLGEPLSPKAGNLVKVVTGMRRSGKSYRLFQEMERVHASGIPWERICYFNFEDDRLAPVTPATGDEVLDAFCSLNSIDGAEGIYLFFDEIQEMDGWGAWLRRVVDTTKATIYVSGSSSKMLSDEISTEFRGRALDFELLPYSFSEYVRARGESATFPSEAALYSAQTRLRFGRLLSSYLDEGGFPASIDLPAPQRIALLQSYVQRVVARDVIERHSIARPRVASLFAQRVMGSNAKAFSIRKVEADLRSLGLSSSRELLGNLLEYLEQAYLIFRVRDFSYALAESSRRTPKLYAIDPGLAHANARANSSELGQRLENAVYLELRRRNPGMRAEAISSFTTKGHGYEIDFVVGDLAYQDAFELYQVCETADDEATKKRELRALWEALEETHLEEGILIMGDETEEELTQAGKRIRLIPAWKWLLSA